MSSHICRAIIVVTSLSSVWCMTSNYLTTLFFKYWNVSTAVSHCRLQLSLFSPPWKNLTPFNVSDLLGTNKREESPRSTEKSQHFHHQKSLPTHREIVSAMWEREMEARENLVWKFFQTKGEPAFMKNVKRWKMCLQRGISVSCV